MNEIKIKEFFSIRNKRKYRLLINFNGYSIIVSPEEKYFFIQYVQYYIAFLLFYFYPIFKLK